MKRTVAAIIIIIFIIVGGIAVCLGIEGILDEMDKELQNAYSAAEGGDFDRALSAVRRFYGIFDENRSFLFVFLKRELLYNLMSDSGTITSYANEEGINDFFAEITKARRHIVIIGDSLFGPF